MQISFSDTGSGDIQLLAIIVNQGSLPDGLEPELAKGAEAARFKGRVGQVFEGFVQRGGKVVRVALAGSGDTSSSERMGNVEKAGAAIAAKYASSGEKSVAVDLGAAGLSADEAAAALLGLRLRTWRYDIYRTKLADEKKISLTSAIVLNAPEGAQAAWADRAALADGVEFTRVLVAEPANKVYPISFVERCQKAFEGTGAELTVLI